MCRVDSETSIKCSAEYETPALSRLGSVVTHRGYSDWATQDIAATVTGLRYKLNRRGSDFRLAWAAEGSAWRQCASRTSTRAPHGSRLASMRAARPGRVSSVACMI